jgi:arylsulfatase A
MKSALLISAFFTLATIAFGCQGFAQGTNHSRPNILLILIDDLGAEGLGCYGGTSYQTPNLDALAKAGTRFDHCYSTPLCSPSRAELLTGRYPFRTGITSVTHMGGSEHDKLDVNKDRTLANFLSDAGYETCIAGKWHLCNDFVDNPTHVADAGFKDQFLWRLMRGKIVTRHFWNPELWVDNKPANQLGIDKYGDDLFADHILNFMSEHRQQPFFAYYPMTLVHNQTFTGKNYPPSPDSRQPGCNPDSACKPKQEAFADLVAYTDKIIGKLMTGLDQMGLRENTIVIVLGDNGTDPGITSRLGERQLQGGKGLLIEAGTRVPLIISWPGDDIKVKVVTDLVDLTDILPTILEAAGVGLPEGYIVDGQSFLSCLRGSTYKPRQWVYSQLGKEWFIRDPHYRLDSNGKLWDMTEDPYSPKPAANNPEIQAVQLRLSKAVKLMME